MLVISFPGGGHLSIEFTDDAPDDEQPQFGAWLELRASDPAAVLQAVLYAGLAEVKHPGHPYHFMIPVVKENLHPRNERNYPLYIGIGTVVLIVIIVVIVLAIRR